ncbi:MAG TPA: ABC transporter permease [Thermoanaerobaculia bacterium]|jgi:ABC-2 type transport system permease protein|nr:ABC transporter permease [Thermoanaerobaculia bacterium]
MMEAAADLWHLFVRLVRANLRMPVFVVISIVQPVIWVLLFGQLFRAVTALPGFGADSYVQFLAPGIAIMTALFGAAYSGMGMLADIDRGVLDRLLATPVARGALLAARILYSAAQVAVQAGIILLVSAAVGARPHGGAAGIAVVLAVAALLGAAFAAFSNALALLTRRQELVIAAMNFVVLPSTFLSSMMMSANLMPSWIRAAALFNPVNWAVVAARAGFEGNWQLLPRHLGLLAAFTLAAAWLAGLSFERYRRAG